jgi:acyl-CoA dehydrogenase
MVELLAEFGTFCADVIAPLNPVGDEQGAAYNPHTGEVTTTPGWKEAYAKYVEAGWGTVSFGEEAGGGGFPWLLTVAMQEILSSANVAFSLCPMLTQGSVEAIAQYGTDEQRATYLTKLASGQWTGTMNLTESHAGSDVGALVTRAEPNADGSWAISGQKIFITYGEHDLAENIVHLLLARAPDAPAGTRGISMFIVPKFLPDGNGGIGERNAVQCTGIEKKMGIHGSPTCTLSFDRATGFLLGEVNSGMRTMFTMMNNARLSVGIEGLGVAERAYQGAVEYARERVQGVTPASPTTTSGSIIEHPDVRRMLLHQRSHIEAMRAMAYATGWAIDTSRGGADDVTRQRGGEIADILTPVTKAWLTDLGSELCRLATQIHGGAGYIRETGVEQHERDVRIASIYEGTNGIQAIDLVTRKVPMRDGSAINELFEEIDKSVGKIGGSLSDFGAQLADALAAAREATDWLLAHRDDPAATLGAASPYLRLLATTLGGYLLSENAAIDPSDETTVATRFYGLHALPLARALLPAVTTSPAPLYDLDAAAF